MQGAADVPFFSKNKVFFAQKSSVQAKKLNFSHRIRQKPFTEDEMLTLILSLIFHIYHAILGIDAPNKFPPPLSPEEESAAFEKARAGDEKARERLILHNLRLVSHIVRKYYGAHRDSLLVNISESLSFLKNNTPLLKTTEPFFKALV